MSLARYTKKKQPAKLPEKPLEVDPNETIDFQGRDGLTMIDYRAADHPEDSELWLHLMANASAVDRELAANLQVFRTRGARLEENPAGGYRITIGEDHDWRDLQEYERERKRWLLTKKDLLIHLLKSLSL